MGTPSPFQFGVQGQSSCVNELWRVARMLERCSLPIGTGRRDTCKREAGSGAAPCRSFAAMPSNHRRERDWDFGPYVFSAMPYFASSRLAFRWPHSTQIVYFANQQDPSGWRVALNLYEIDCVSVERLWSHIRVRSFDLCARIHASSSFEFMVLLASSNFLPALAAWFATANDKTITRNFVARIRTMHRFFRLWQSRLPSQVRRLCLGRSRNRAEAHQQDPTDRRSRRDGSRNTRRFLSCIEHATLYARVTRKHRSIHAAPRLLAQARKSFLYRCDLDPREAEPLLSRLCWNQERGARWGQSDHHGP